LVIVRNLPLKLNFHLHIPLKHSWPCELRSFVLEESLLFRILSSSSSSTVANRLAIFVVVCK
jgi:hypothetical protein